MGTFLNWTFTMIVGFFTPFFFSNLGKQTTFQIYASTCGLGFFFILIFVKETRGLLPAELIDLYRPDFYKVEVTTGGIRKERSMSTNASSLLTTVKPENSQYPRLLDDHSNQSTLLYKSEKISFKSYQLQTCDFGGKGSPKNQLYKSD